MAACGVVALGLGGALHRRQAPCLGGPVLDSPSDVLQLRGAELVLAPHSSFARASLALVVDRAKGQGTQRAKCKSGDSDPSGRELSPSVAADDRRPQRTRRRPACGWPPASGRGASRGSGVVHRRTFHHDALGPLADPSGCSRCFADTSVTQLSDRAIGRRPWRQRRAFLERCCLCVEAVARPGG
jgi:hypothetical protein